MAKKNVQENTQAIVNTAETIEEGATMANEVINNTNAEAIENVKEEGTMAENTTIENAQATEEIAEPAAPKTMLLFTASRGKNTKLAWSKVTVNEGDPTVKVKGCAIELPVQAAEIIGNDKFVSYIDLDIIARCVEEKKAVRGTASTVSDVFNRYCKVTDTKGDRVSVALEVFAEVLNAIAGDTNNGAWVRPEPEKEEAPVETTTEAPTEDTVIDAPAEEATEAPTDEQ